MTFGDGWSWVGSSNGTVAVLHQYAAPASGTQYWADATATDAGGSSSNTSLLVTVNYTTSSGSTGSQVNWTSPTTFSAHAWNGSLTVIANGTLTPSPTSESFSLTGRVSDSSSNFTGYSAQVSNANGTVLSSTNATGGSSIGINSSYVFTAVGSDLFGLQAWSSAGPVAGFRVTLPIGFANNSGGNNHTSSGASVRWTSPTSFLVSAWNGSLNAQLVGYLNPAPSSERLFFNSTASSVNASWVGVVVSAVSPTGVTLSPTYNNSGTSPVAVSGGYNFAVQGTGSLLFGASDSLSEQTSVNLSVPVVFQNSSGGGNQTPARVSVTVAASPVTGAAPLTVNYSAYISGGAPPFSVDWNLPGGTGPVNVTGLSASQTYNASGWYPATAFVYNRSNAFGTVLIGVGSVWVYVSGSASGNNSSGTGSHGLPHSGSSNPAPGGSVAASMSPVIGLLLLLGVGALAGGVVGYIFGRGGRRGPPPRIASGPNAPAAPPRS